MAWSSPMTAVADTIFTASQYNRYIRDNFFETAPAKATEASQYFVVSGVNSISPRKIGKDFVGDSFESTDSETYTDLTTPGPTVTVETGNRAIVIIQAGMQPGSSNRFQAMSFEVSGASSIAASDDNAIFQDGISSGVGNLRYGTAYMTDGLTAGTNVFQAKYRRGAGTSVDMSFVYRSLIVIPF